MNTKSVCLSVFAISLASPNLAFPLCIACMPHKFSSDCLTYLIGSRSQDSRRNLPALVWALNGWAVCPGEAAHLLAAIMVAARQTASPSGLDGRQFRIVSNVSACDGEK